MFWRVRLYQSHSSHCPKEMSFLSIKQLGDNHHALYIFLLHATRDMQCKHVGIIRIRKEKKRFRRLRAGRPQARHKATKMGFQPQQLPGCVMRGAKPRHSPPKKNSYGTFHGLTPSMTWKPIREPIYIFFHGSFASAQSEPLGSPKETTDIYIYMVPPPMYPHFLGFSL